MPIADLKDLRLDSEQLAIGNWKLEMN